MNKTVQENKNEKKCLNKLQLELKHHGYNYRKAMPQYKGKVYSMFLWKQ